MLLSLRVINTVIASIITMKRISIRLVLLLLNILNIFIKKVNLPNEMDIASIEKSRNSNGIMRPDAGLGLAKAEAPLLIVGFGC
ncbi:hypothetical protein PYJP_19420 [Pyrofollis japonicus]|nr:hypothetical protein PYJP_19420 [Pyrofollis japonicus]